MALDVLADFVEVDDLADFVDARARLGRVPFSVTRPPVFLLGGATARESTLADVTRALVIDNYDSFVFNLVQYLGELGAEPIVHRNDALTLDEALALRPDVVVLSPGPGRPEDAGICCEAAIAFGERDVPVLGVCLGHQAIGHAFGARIVGATELMHGKTSEIEHIGRGLFAGLESPLCATRYHSLTIEPDSIPDELEVTATTADGTVMGVRHRRLPVEGVQFHPESILSAGGHQLLANLLAQVPSTRVDGTSEPCTSRGRSRNAG
ncbi:hypothetical protein BH20ACT4_BH20ACT4_02100 [soil metagenome]